MNQHQTLLVTGAELKPQYLPARHEVQHAYSSHDKVARIFGYPPRDSLEDGIHRMASWVKKAGARPWRTGNLPPGR